MKRRVDDPPYGMAMKWRRAYLAANPVCVRCSAARAVDVHEKLTRARGGSIVDEANVVALCRQCHDDIHNGRYDGRRK